MRSNVTITEAEPFGGSYNGVHFGPGVVLARTDQQAILWIRGRAVWSGTGQPWTYAPAHLIKIDRPDRGIGNRLATGGRLKAQIKEAAARIDEFFGDGFHALLEPGKTVIIGQCRPLERWERG
jgi:hypothetical protein